MSRHRRAALAAAAVGMALVASLWLASETARGQVPLPPNRFFGQVSVNPPKGAPAGTDVVATINGNICGETDVQADGGYVLDVLFTGPPQGEPYVRPGCGTEGATVDFWVGGQPAGTATFHVGTFSPLNLSITADCMLGDDSGRGTGLLIWGDDWRFVAPGEDLAGSGVRWFFGRFLVFGRSGSAMAVAFGSCPWGGGTGMAMDLSARRLLRLVDTTSLPPLPLPSPPPPPPPPLPAPPVGPTEVLALPAGCSLVTSTYPDGTPPVTLAANLSPQSGISGIWRSQFPVWGGFQPYTPSYASNMGRLQFLDAIFVCVNTPHFLVRPMP